MRSTNLFGTVLLLLVALLILPPFLMLFIGSFWGAPPGDPGQLSLKAYTAVYSSPQTYKVLWNSFFIALTSSVIALIWGVSLAWLVVRTDVPVRPLLQILMPIPFFLPGLFTVFAWIFLANPFNGVINQLLQGIFGLQKPPLNIYSHTGIIFVMTLGSVSFVYLLTIAALKGLDPSLEESARTCGAGMAPTLFRVTLPMIAPALLGTFILTFISDLGAFDIPIFLGQPVGIHVFATEIYRAITFRDPPRYGEATALGVTLMAVTLFLVIIQWRLLGERQYFTITGRGYNPHPIKLGHWRWPAFSLLLLYFLLAEVFPIAQLIVSSFSRLPGIYKLEFFTLENYRSAFSDTIVLRALRNTLFLALLAGLLGASLSALIAYVVARTGFWGKKVLDLVTWLPKILSPIVLATGMLWAYLMLPVFSELYGTLWILLIAFLINGLPYGVRVLSGTVVQISNELEECARAHGASWARTMLCIVVPLVRPGMLASGILFAYIAVRSLSTPVLLYGYGTEVLTITMLRYWTEGRQGVVSVLVLVMLLILMAVSALEWAFFGVRERVKPRTAEPEVMVKPVATGVVP